MTSAEPELRRARPGEAGEILAMWRRAETTPSYTDDPASIEAAIASLSAEIMVAVENDEIVGSLIAGFDGWRGNFYRLAVAAHRRRDGIASALVAAGEVHMRACGAKRINVLVEGDHDDSVGFWDAAGYTYVVRMRRYVKNLDD